MSQSDERPLVSVVMANFNGAAFLAEALRSALAQSLASLEVVLADGARLPFDHLVLATGARNAPPPLPGLDLPMEVVRLDGGLRMTPR